MKPYYDQDGITIYHGDCADVLPLVDPSEVSLLIADPPYGIGWNANYRSFDAGSGTFGISKRLQPAITNDDQPFDPGPLLAFGRVVIFGAQHFLTRLPDGGGFIVWDKTGEKVAPPGHMSEAEIAWTNLTTTVRLYKELWLGGMRDFTSPDRKLRVHPTQKPMRLMCWILDKWTQPSDLILDPYMGSGPVAQACHEMGRRYIGVELVEEYCEAAVQRLAQGALAFETEPGRP